ncbi:unnamed protein product [Pneumocystis jirovecii]|uniref:Uncharacterized protein n=2 Tax=Pneumocystis jirovecii TaxID=42068 RepID=L0PDZ5_PNEJI|nr:uncharacterized protein T551_00731 [Pneumocystis jirovecii RU7]KTW32049.1 hypothetical protein T551_00731 [Pneumocystis jirovecii RU7]CCJ30583.1 unnamed protein product [Pneumocystis jirovecii]
MYRQSTTPAQIKSRQLSHLHSQLAQLHAHLSDLENHFRVTAIQAEAIRRLGGLQGSMFMAATKIFGEENFENTGQS